MYIFLLLNSRTCASRMINLEATMYVVYYYVFFVCMVLLFFFVLNYVDEV